MLFVYLLAISFLFFFGVLNGQHLQLNTTTFDVSGCADPLGTYECYLSASSVWQNISAKCNQTDAVCLQAQRTIYQMDTLGCMAADCWNQVGSWQANYNKTLNRIGSNVRIRIHDSSFLSRAGRWVSFGHELSTVCAYKPSQCSWSLW